MKVVIQGYNTCCQNKTGGIQLRIRKIASLLQERGIDVELFAPFATQLTTADVLHVFMPHYENYGLIRCAKEKGLRIVISPVMNLDRAIKTDIYLKIIHKMHIATPVAIEMNTYQLADMIIVETESEKRFLHRHYGIGLDKISVIPNGVNETAYEGDEIFNVIGGEKNYILQVGRFDKNKNQLSVIKAMKDSGIDLVFVGGPDHSIGKAYYESCLLEAKGCMNVHFLGWLDNQSSLLKSAYAHANVVVLPSFQETFGLVLLEGAMAGAKLAISDTLPILGYSVFDECVRFDPHNVSKIREALLEAVEKPVNPQLKNEVMKFFSWDRIIDEHIKIYSE